VCTVKFPRGSEEKREKTTVSAGEEEPCFRDFENLKESSPEKKGDKNFVNE
jgi:hypothetical protein